MKKITQLIFVSIFILFSNTIFGQYLFTADSNMTLLGREPNGYCNAVMPFNSTYLLAGSGRGVRIIDYSDAEHPVMIAQINTESEVSGIAVNGNYAYIATNSPYGEFSEGFYIVDLSDITNPQIDYYESYSSTAGAFAIANNGSYVFVATNGYVYCYDASNPTHPQKLSIMSVSNAPHGVFYSDNKLYVAAQSSGLVIFDVSNPAQPVRVGSLASWAEKCAVRDTLAFLVKQADQMEIVSVSDPANPFVISKLPKDTLASMEYLMDVKVKGNLVYIAGDAYIQDVGQMAQLKIADVSNPSAPKVLNSFFNPFNMGASERGLSVQLLNNKCFMAFGNGFQIFDVTNSQNIKLLSNYFTYRRDGKVKFANGYLVMAYRTLRDSVNGFTIYDVSNPQSIVEESNYFLKGDGGNFDLAVDGNILCLTDTRQISVVDTLSAVHIFDISVPSQPKELNAIKVPFVMQSPAVAVNNNLLCFIDRSVVGEDSLRVVDISDPRHPIDVGGYHVDAWKEGYTVQKMEFNGTYLLLGNTQGLLILSLANPSNPTFVDYYDYPANDYNCYGMKVKGGSVYLSHAEGFEIVNITNPANITKEFYYKTKRGFVLDIDYDAANGDIYLSDGRVDIVSLGGDSSIVSQGYYDTKVYRPHGLIFENNKLYVSYFGLHILKKGIDTDVKTNEALKPLNFKLEQNYPNPFNPTTTIKYSIPSVIARSSVEYGTTKQSTEYSDISNNSTDCHASLRSSRNDGAFQVSLTVYDILGRKVTTLVNKAQKPGNYSVQFNAGNLPSGVYFYRLKAGDFTITKKMVLLR